MCKSVSPSCFSGFLLYNLKVSSLRLLLPKFLGGPRVFGYSPAVSQEALQDVGGPGRSKDGPFDASVFEVAAVDLVGAEPLFDALLDAVGLGKAYRARTWREAVIHKVHRILKQGRVIGRRKRIRANFLIFTSATAGQISISVM